MTIIFPCFSSGQGIIINSGASVTELGGNLILSGNWINDGTFNATDGTVVFAGSDQAIGGSSAATFKNINVLPGSTTTILTAGQKLEDVLIVDGTLNAGGNLTLLSTASGTALISGEGSGQVYGNVTMERYLPSGFGYKYFSSPFQAAAVSEFGDDMNLAASFTSFYKYDESRTSSGWVNYKTSANVLNPGAGYAVNFGSDPAANTVDVTGVVNNGNQSLTLYNHNNTWTKGFNLVGNPFPSPIDWNAFSGWTKTNIDNSLYFFKASSTDQYGGTYSTLINGLSSDGLASNIIPSMQGFLVHVTDGAFPVTGVLQMDNGTRVTNQSQPFIKSDIVRSLLRLTASFSDNSDFPDFSVIYLDERASTSFDGQLDALKLMNTDFAVPNVYIETPTAAKTSIKALPYFKDSLYSVPLGLKINKPGEVIFKIQDIEGDFKAVKISLTDKMTSSEQSLLDSQAYRILLEAGEYNDRFFLNFSNTVTDIPENSPLSELYSIYYSKGVIVANVTNLEGGEGTVYICNMLGQILIKDKLYAEGYNELSHHLKDGIYITVFISGKTRITKKIIIIN